MGTAEMRGCNVGTCAVLCLALGNEDHVRGKAFCAIRDVSDSPRRLAQ